MEEIFKKIKSLFLFCFLLFVFFNILPLTAKAATLYFSPSSGSHAVGDTFSIGVYVSSSDKTMNAASGVISFPADKLDVVSISKVSSIFSLWVQEPSFSNIVGTINFEGIVLNPGFIGSGGKIINITFKAKSMGIIPITFSSASVLANDGVGTNILSGVGNVSLSLSMPAIGPQVPQSAIPSENVGAPLAPVITSPTHSDPEKWYSDSNPKFVWQIPSDVSSVRLLYDKFPNSIPQVVYSPAISEKKLQNVKDGIWYFHVQFFDSNGWGAVSHFRFQIDTNPPEPFNIEIFGGEVSTSSRPILLFDTVDNLSGIDYYKIKIGDGDYSVISTQEVKHNPYTLPPQAPGNHTVLVKAFDKAGNYSANTSDVNVMSLDIPVVVDYPKELSPGQHLVVKGKTKAEYHLSIWLVEENGQPKRFTLYPEADGTFTFITPDVLETGVYTFWIVALNSDSLSSDPTEKYTIIVNPTKAEKIISSSTKLLSLAVPLLGLIIILIFMILYGWHKFKLFKNKLSKIRKEVREAESALHKSFNLLKVGIHEQVKLLERARGKRQLTEEEEKIVKNLKEDLDTAEKIMEKEISDIEKEAK